MEYTITPKVYKPGNPIPLRLEVDINGITIYYDRLRPTSSEYPGYVFYTSTKTSKEEAEAMIKALIERILDEQDEEEHGVSWRTVSFQYVDNWLYHTFEWRYRVRDSY